MSNQAQLDRLYDRLDFLHLELDKLMNKFLSDDEQCTLRHLCTSLDIVEASILKLGGEI